MVKAYQGELYKVPVVGHVAEGILPATWHGEKPGGSEERKSTKTEQAPSPSISEKTEELGKRVEEYFTRTKAGRIAGYSASIFWSVVLLIFLSFFHQYIAWYHVEPSGSVTILRLLTGDYLSWLPILITALVMSITANILLIIYDRHWLRDIIQIILTVIGVVVVVNLISIFPWHQVPISMAWRRSFAN